MPWYYIKEAILEGLWCRKRKCQERVRVRSSPGVPFLPFPYGKLCPKSNLLAVRTACRLLGCPVLTWFPLQVREPVPFVDLKYSKRQGWEGSVQYTTITEHSISCGWLRKLKTAGEGRPLIILLERAFHPLGPTVLFRFMSEDLRDLCWIVLYVVWYVQTFSFFWGKI